MRKLTPVFIPLSFMLLWWAGLSSPGQMEWMLRTGIILAIAGCLIGSAIRIQTLKKEAEQAQPMRRRRPRHKPELKEGAEPPAPRWFRELPKEIANGRHPE